jgi:hypothetical protein
MARASSVATAQAPRPTPENRRDRSHHDTETGSDPAHALLRRCPCAWLSLAVGGTISAGHLIDVDLPERVAPGTPGPWVTPPPAHTPRRLVISGGFCVDGGHDRQLSDQAPDGEDSPTCAAACKPSSTRAGASPSSPSTWPPPNRPSAAPSPTTTSPSSPPRTARPPATPRRPAAPRHPGRRAWLPERAGLPGGPGRRARVVGDAAGCGTRRRSHHGAVPDGPARSSAGEANPAAARRGRARTRTPGTGTSRAAATPGPACGLRTHVDRIARHPSRVGWTLPAVGSIIGMARRCQPGIRRW